MHDSAFRLEGDEERTVQAAQRGDLGAFNTLVLAHQALAYNVALRILGDPEAAADATQESFLKAYRALARFRGGSFLAWLLRILTNTCYDLLRFGKRHPSLPLDVAEANDEPGAGERWPANAESLENLALRHELNDSIQAAIGQLPPEQRVVVVLHDVEGLTYADIATTTGQPLGTVKSRLARARARLRDLLRTDGGLPDRRSLQGSHTRWLPSAMDFQRAAGIVAGGL